ncbi:MAG: amino acid permease [Candidatus Bathyarchaeota archaeon]|nr:amino acid permease [Candidatus Bathyarchaeota archaeon]MDH5787418.1 amino acid permease [Candidatus Bathyarchaeota archaeon]
MCAEDSRQSGFKPSLSLFDATAISVGAIIGAGIFIVTGIAAGFAGSALIISMFIAAVIALFTALSLAELTAWQPREGSIYEYTYQLISPFAGFLVGWMWILSNTFTGAAVSLGFAYYLTALFPILPANWIAAILCIAFTALNFFGVRQSALLNNILVAAKLLILAFFAIYGVWHINTANFASFAPFETGVFYGAFYIFFAYGGFARVAVIAEEIKDPKHNVPRAIILSLAISTIVYILVGIVAVGLVGAQQLAQSNSPLKDAISQTGTGAAVYIVSLGGLLATASVLLTSILGVSRMAYAMARRKDLPQALGALHKKYYTPYNSLWIIGVLMTLLVLFIDLTRVVAISTFALLFYYTLANVSALRMKTENRKYPRVVPAIGAATCLALLIFALFASLQSWIIGVASLLIGAVYYLGKQKFK